MNSNSYDTKALKVSANTLIVSLTFLLFLIVSLIVGYVLEVVIPEHLGWWDQTASHWTSKYVGYAVAFILGFKHGWKTKE